MLVGKIRMLVGLFSTHCMLPSKRNKLACLNDDLCRIRQKPTQREAPHFTPHLGQIWLLDRKCLPSIFIEIVVKLIGPLWVWVIQVLYPWLAGPSPELMSTSTPWRRTWPSGSTSWWQCHKTFSFFANDSGARQNACHLQLRMESTLEGHLV